MKAKTKISVLTLVAIIFHAIGFIGIGLLKNDIVLKATPFHLLLMFVLLAMSYQKRFTLFFKWTAIVFIAGFVVELIGTRTGWLFGSYAYSDVLGYKFLGVPLLIGLNWVMVLTGAIAVSSIFWQNKWTICLAAASLATFYDWLLEPVAIKLDYWHWNNLIVPPYNYLCWWGISFILVYVWTVLKMKPNNFSAILFTIQAVFFALLQMV